MSKEAKKRYSVDAGISGLSLEDAVEKVCSGIKRRLSYVTVIEDGTSIDALYEILDIVNDLQNHK
jgi:hypothetical protein